MTEVGGLADDWQYQICPTWVAAPRNARELAREFREAAVQVAIDNMNNVMSEPQPEPDRRSNGETEDECEDEYEDDEDEDDIKEKDYMDECEDGMPVAKAAPKQIQSRRNLGRR